MQRETTVFERVDCGVAQRDWWSQRLGAGFPRTELPADRPRSPASSFYRESVALRLDTSATSRLRDAASSLGVDHLTLLLAGVCGLTQRYSGATTVGIGVVAERDGHANPLPLAVEIDPQTDLAGLVATVAEAMHGVARHAALEYAEIARLANWNVCPFRLLFRTEGIASALASAACDTDPGEVGMACDAVLTAAADGPELELRLDVDGELFDVATAERMLGHYARLLSAFADPGCALRSAPLLAPEERTLILRGWNDTAREYARDACVHDLVARQAGATPDATAFVFGDRTLCYRELDARANRLAHLLVARGVGPDRLVGLWLDRGVDLIVSVLAVLKAGGAYVPMDPHYPPQRLVQMATDSGTELILTRSDVHGELRGVSARLLRLDEFEGEIDALPESAPTVGVAPHHLAYVIYTSGSTGTPKGVMVEHRNVVSFFAGMDERIAGGPGTWLAVTSLSFDISVLELLWTLSRGLQIVMFSTAHQRGEDFAATHRRPASMTQQSTDAPAKGMDFDLFYFASDEGAGSRPGKERYRLLWEGARFADERGFSAVWTPERHFDKFGGLYPAPTVASGALSMITRRVSIRTGSIVLPLHDPVRVAEELQLVDNLSDGRTGVAFASGWQPDDFVFAPHVYADRQQFTYDAIDTIRRLWRGDAVTRRNGVGKDKTFRTLPRPVQSELPIWLTCGGATPTFVKAGELGCNILTHLLGQTVEDLTEKLRLYRDAWRRAGHAGEGYVTLMLHTFVGDDVDRVRERVHEPLKRYLEGSQGLFAGYAKELGIDMASMTDEDRDALAEHSFQRYYETSGLFGTPETCKPFVERLRGLGVDSIACLIDFGIPNDEVLEHLEFLDRLRASCRFIDQPAAEHQSRDAPYSIQALIRTHGITHLQCTPSMVTMLLADADTTDALSRVPNVMIGGEAFPPQLATRLRELNPAIRLTNMYGPTETTVWSSTHDVVRAENPVPIGRPIANTRIYVLDERREPVPAGVVGELWIAGDGVVRGYLGRPELTAERFVPDPMVDDPGSRMYRTGDLARFRTDGTIEFLGRADHQVKFRGFRIELGEIETLLARQPSVREAVVIVREETSGDTRLVAYVVPRPGHRIDPGALRDVLKAALPDYMVPTAYVALDALPLTPNAKIDRRALPAPDAAAKAADSAFVAPARDVERQVAEIWKAVLRVPRVGLSDNFFDLGGHSVLVVHVLNQLRGLGYELAMTDLFQYPTIESLANFLSPDGEKSAVARKGVDRAAVRRERMARRRPGS